MQIFRILLKSRNSDTYFFAMDICDSLEKAQALLDSHPSWKDAHGKIVMFEVVAYG